MCIRDRVDIVEEEDLGAVSASSISKAAFLLCSRFLFRYLIISLVPLESTSKSTLMLSIGAFTPISSCYNPTETVYGYLLNWITISSSSLSLSGVVVVEVF